MKRLVLYLVFFGLSFAAGALIIHLQAEKRHRADLQNQQALWEKERAELLAELEQANARPTTQVVAASAVAPLVNARLSPAEIIERLKALRTPGIAQIREAVYWLEELVQAGPAAVPPIRQFLTAKEDLHLDLNALPNRAPRDGRLPGDFLLPPTLRFGLFDVLRRIGGDEAELALAESLSTSVFGLEIAYLTRMLHELAPNKHRENALTIARALLASGTSPVSGAVDSRTPPQNPMVRNHREYLFAVLSFYGDSSFASDAQRQLVGTDTQIDRGALRYLQRALGAEAIPVVAQVYNNPQLGTNAAAKEPLARLALNFVGQDARANAFYQQAINDPALTRSHRRNLIEDLNEDGFADPRNLTGNDLPLIQNRIALIEQLAPYAMDQVNAEAFQEAYKDLINMRRRASQPPGQPASFRGQNSINSPGQ